MRFNTGLKFFGLCTLIAAFMMLAAVSMVAAEEEKKMEEDKEPIRVLMSTTLGDITIELNLEKAPISVANFLNYVDKGYYEGTVFHRVISNFMIQGGGFTPDMVQKKVDPPIANEWQNGLKNMTGTIAMARRNEPNSATSQFYINVKDNHALDQPRGGAAYAVFGKVVEGMKVVEKIKMAKTGVSGGHRDVPVEPIIVNKVVRLDKDGKPIENKAAADSTKKE